MIQKTASASSRGPRSPEGNNDGVCALGDVGADVVQVELHCLGVGALYGDGGPGPALWADGSEEIDAAFTKVGDLAGSGSGRGPDTGAVGLLADAHLVLF